MDIKTTIPLGTKLKVLKTEDIVTLEEIRNYPTRFVTKDKFGNIEYYKTFEVEIFETTE